MVRRVRHRKHRLVQVRARPCWRTGFSQRRRTARSHGRLHGMRSRFPAAAIGCGFLLDSVQAAGLSDALIRNRRVTPFPIGAMGDMLFDESAIVAEHKALIKPGNLGEMYLGGMGGCCKLLHRLGSDTDHKGNLEIVTIMDLAGHSALSCGAGMHLSAASYWAPATQQLRHLVESEQLFELFQLIPEEALVWRSSTGKNRHNRYRDAKIRERLTDLRGDP